MIKIAPSILSADFADFKSAVIMLEDFNADYIHCDVMDGSFVKNITFGHQTVAAIKKYTKLPLDVHLMIDNPENHIEKFYKAGADIITVHAEATNHLHGLLQTIKSFGIQCGVSINPATPLSQIQEIICDVDLVLIMSVNPGMGGQKFIPNSLKKIKDLKSLIKSTGSHALIEVDGGVNLENAKDLCDAGVDILVAGSAIFSSNNIKQTIKDMKTLC